MYHKTACFFNFPPSTQQKEPVKNFIIDRV